MKFPLQHLPEVPSNASCLDLLNFFQEGKSNSSLLRCGAYFQAQKVTLPWLPKKMYGKRGERFIWAL